MTTTLTRVSSYRLSPSGGSEPWFRLGRIEVTTTVAAILVVVAGWLTWVIGGPGMPTALAFWPEGLATGDVWRLVSWPLADAPSLFGVINLFFFWYFGSDLEGQVGRSNMLRLLLGIAAALMISTTLLSLPLGSSLMLAGLGTVQFTVFLIWIAENPRRPFFFGIPAWMIGAILLGLQVITLLGVRGWPNLLSLLLGLALSAIVARRVGLLGDQGWIPGRRRRPRSARAASAQQHPAGRASAPRGAARKEAKAAQRAQSDRERLDALLDRISAEGIGALSDSERKELMALRDRLRGGR